MRGNYFFVKEHREDTLIGKIDAEKRKKKKQQKRKKKKPKDNR